ncbi:MAG: hypothetical protein IPJ40_20195 [Saprospirales bacterium]|nr:hypothetical protein [Saprospirales bacterium]
MPGCQIGVGCGTLLREYWSFPGCTTMALICSGFFSLLLVQDFRHLRFCTRHHLARYPGHCPGK